MSEYIKQDMQELADMLSKALNKILKETRTKSGKNVLDLSVERDKFSEHVADKLIEAGFIDISDRQEFIENDSSFFCIDFHNMDDMSKSWFEVSHEYCEHTLQLLKDAEEALKENIINPKQ